MDDIIKICKIHGPLTEKDVRKSSISINKRGYGPYYHCKICRSLSAKKCNRKNREKRLAKCKNYYENNKEKSREMCKNWYRNNIDKIKEYNRKYRQNNMDKMNSFNKKYRLNLKNGYIKQLICQNSNLLPQDIPQEFVESYRQHLLLIRKLKEVNHGTKHS